MTVQANCLTTYRAVHSSGPRSAILVRYIVLHSTEGPTAKGVAFTPGGRWFTIGCIVCNSSTQGSKTIGSADCLFDVQYIPQVI